MRVFAQCAAAGCLAAIVTISGPVTAQTKDPEAILAAARAALGGEKKLTAVKTFTATGRTKQVRGDNLVPIEFEVFVELPDKYLRKDEIPAQESGPTASGFNGETWLQDPPPPAPPVVPAPSAPPAAAPARGAAAPPAASAPPPAGGTTAPPPAGGRAAPPPAGAAGAPPAAAGAPGPPGRDAMPGPMSPGGPAGPPRNPAAARVATLKQDFARLTLGMFATSFPTYPLTFSYVGEAEAPQGKADVLEAKGPNNFTMRLFINKETHLPIMVSWTNPVPAGRPGGPGLGGRGAMPGPPAGERGGPPPAGERGAPPPAGERGAPPSASGRPSTGSGQAAQGPPPAGDRPPTGSGQPAQAPPAVAPPPGGERGAAPGAPGAPGPQRGAPTAPVEQRLYFADYRDVDGMQFPFRLRRATGTETTEETTFDRYKINAKIDPKKFEVRKPQ